MHTHTHIHKYRNVLYNFATVVHFILQKMNNWSEKTSGCRQLRLSPVEVLVGVPALHLSFATFEGRKYV